MSKVVKMAEILRNVNTANSVVLVSTGTTARYFEIPVQILKNSTDGKNVNQVLTVYANTAMSRGISQIRAYLERRCRYKDVFSRYALDESFVNEFIEKVNFVNTEIEEEAEAFVADYETHRKETEDAIIAICAANKRKGQAKGIVKKAMSRYPSKQQILNGSVTYIMDTDGSEAYEGLQKATKDLVDASRARVFEANRCAHLSHRCNPVFESLFKFSKQIVENGKLHGITVTAFLDAVEVLRIANKTEFASPLPDLTDFLNNAGKAIDDPDIYIDAMIMGFSRFYASQGMLDYIPYDVAMATGYTREIIEDIGNDPNNSFVILFKSVEPPEMTYAAI